MVGTLKDMRLFVAAYEERSFTAAADREHATQSGVSQHIRSLELGLRVALFHRGEGRISPTPAADAYYRACLEVLKWHETSIDTARSFAKGIEGAVTVGLMPTLTRNCITPALRHFMDEHPNVNIRIVEDYSGALTRLAQAGELDFAIVPDSIGLPGVVSKIVMDIPEVLVSGIEAKTGQMAPVNLASLSGLQVIVPSSGNVRHSSLLSYFNSNSVKVDRILELDSMFGTLALIRESSWVAVLPAILMEIADLDAGYVINPIVAPELFLRLVVIEAARRPMSNAAKLLFDTLLTEMRVRGNQWSARGIGPWA